MEEIWKDVENYEGYYQVSNSGRVRSLSRMLDYRKSIHGDWFHQRIHRGQLLRPVTRKDGYMRLFLRKKRKMKSKYVHRLVAEAFIPNPENKPQINHKNGIKADCKVGNLEWATSFENNLHALKTGLRMSTKGEAHPRAIINNFQARVIKKTNSKELGTNYLASIFGISPSTISCIRYGHSWKHLK